MRREFGCVTRVTVRALGLRDVPRRSCGVADEMAADLGISFKRVGRHGHAKRADPGTREFAGSRTSFAETRKLAAILAADVVGYSRLMGEDEARTARAVREHREAATSIVPGFGGRIVNTTGDGLLLEFRSVVAAVECAIAMQRLMVERNAGTADDKRIFYRIGVNLGDVLIEGDDIVGDGVNIAARLEGICDPGGVMLSGSVHDHVRGRIDATFVDLGERDLKNITRPVRVYAISAGSQCVAPIGSSSALNRQTPPRLSIVVLPFADIGGVPEQDHFADGVTESLTTDLSRIRGAFVIARNTAFTYKVGRSTRERSGAS